MNKWTRILLLVVIVGAVVWFLSRPERYDFVNDPPSATGPWVAFGDSLTEGLGASDGKDYPAVLGGLLGTRIVNLGRSGETSRDGLKRINDVVQLQPRVVLLCFGGNDALEQMSPDKMYKNIGQMIEQLHEGGSFVVLIGVRSASVRDQNEKGFRRLAKEKKVFYVPNILQGVLFKPVYMSDTVHPNDLGYRYIAERLYKELSRSGKLEVLKN